MIGPFNVGGAIEIEYDQAGGWNMFGNPTTPEQNANYTGKFQVFEKSNSIYWHADTGAHQVGGRIRDKWQDLGWENGFLHFPITRESAANGGRFNHFQGGSIYWSSATDAHQVSGMIRDKWSAMNWENSPLQFPTTDEFSAGGGSGRGNHFQGGSIYWSAGTGAHPVWGAVRDIWASRNWENGRFGYPTSDEYDFNGGKAQNFQGGRIDWLPGDPPGDQVTDALVSPDPTGATTYSDYPYTPPVVSPLAPVAPDAAQQDIGTDADPSASVIPSTTVPSTTVSPSQTASVQSPAPGLRSDKVLGFAGSRPRTQLPPDYDDLGPERACAIRMSQPHPSNGYINEIHTRVDSTCNVAVGLTYHRISSTMFRFRWLGAESLPPTGTGDPREKISATAKSLRVTATAFCKRDTYYVYRTSAQGQITVGGKNFYSTQSIRTPQEIKCDNSNWAR